MYTCIIILLSLTICVSGAPNMKKMGEMVERVSFRLKGPILPQIKDTHCHEVIIAVKQNNLDILENILYERSDPESILYQQWLNSEEIAMYIENKPAVEAIKAWVKMLPKAKITWESIRNEYIKVVAPLSTWESALNTQFFEWEDLERNRKSNENSKSFTYFNAREYYIPNNLVDHIEVIFNTVQAPPIIRSGSVEYNDENQFNMQASIASDAVTIQLLNSRYRITSNQGSSKLSQSTFETNSEYYSESDLAKFQSQFNISRQSAVPVNGFQLESTANVQCRTKSNVIVSPNVGVSCAEGNLDVQLLTGLARRTQTLYWYTNPAGNPFLTWILQVTSTSNPPSVNSISWVTDEKSADASTMTMFNIEAMKLGLQGVSIFASSGDDGVASRDSNGVCQCNVNSGSTQQKARWNGTNTWTGRGYFPLFPASSPFVTAVGATMGLNVGQVESTCQSDRGGVITSGGGFSSFFRQPMYQTRAVQSYFKNGNYSSGYNSLGRGYPDISFLGVKYPVFIDGIVTYQYGTSASAPVLASLISLINAQRLNLGLSTVGFINPTLYNLGLSGRSTFNDITIGNNRCCYNDGTPVTCCRSGFNATRGWDPVTGWGSINYPQLAILFGVNVSFIQNSNNEPDSSLPGLTGTEVIGVVSACAVGITIIAACYSYYLYSKEVEAEIVGQRDIVVHNGSTASQNDHRIGVLEIEGVIPANRNSPLNSVFRGVL